MIQDMELKVAVRSHDLKFTQGMWHRLEYGTRDYKPPPRGGHVPQTGILEL